MHVFYCVKKSEEGLYGVEQVGSMRVREGVLFDGVQGRETSSILYAFDLLRTAVFHIHTIKSDG